MLAGILIYLFVSHDRKAAVQTPATITVYRASGYIPAGTPEALIAKEGLLKPVQLPATQAVGGAITDPGVIAGQVAATSIAEGQQVTATDFSHQSVTISSYLNGNERAVGFALDAPHGLTAYIQQGDDVDMLVQKTAQNATVTEMLAQNVPVLANQGGDVILRLTDRQSLAVIAAQGSGTLWLELRPSVGSKQTVRVGTVEAL